jgi:mannose-6-phosphate isomerase
MQLMEVFMLYPFKFKPVFKDYIWGGRNLESLNKQIPDGITAESWEISCRPEGMSIIANGEYAGQPLANVLAKHNPEITGYSIYDQDTDKFPLLVKFIDANDRLSVQVHPNDEYAERNENGELGKSEMWYILSAKKGAKVIYDVVPGTDKRSLETAIKAGSVEASLKSVDVFEGDVITYQQVLFMHWEKVSCSLKFNKIPIQPIGFMTMTELIKMGINGLYISKRLLM